MTTFEAGSHCYAAGSGNHVIKHANAQGGIHSGVLHLPVHRNPLRRILDDENRGVRLGGLQDLRLHKSLLDQRRRLFGGRPFHMHAPN